jgi:hypothetical protein
MRTVVGSFFRLVGMTSLIQMWHNPSQRGFSYTFSYVQAHCLCNRLGVGKIPLPCV